MKNNSEAVPQEEALISLTASGFERIIKSVEERVTERIRSNPEKFLPIHINAESNDEFDLYTVTEASEFLKISEGKIRTLCKEGKLTYSVPSGRAILLSKKTLKNYLQSVTND